MVGCVFASAVLALELRSTPRTQMHHSSHTHTKSPHTSDLICCGVSDDQMMRNLLQAPPSGRREAVVAGEDDANSVGDRLSRLKAFHASLKVISTGKR